MISATMHYPMGEQTWTHSFTSWRVDDRELASLLRDTRMRLVRFLDPEQGWILAVPC